MKNLFDDIPHDLSEEVFETLHASNCVRLERIVSHEHASPDDFWYDQDRHEWVVVLKGAALLRFENEDELLELKAGDFVNIPAHKRHRVEWTSAGEPTIWLAVHYDADSNE